MTHECAWRTLLTASSIHTPQVFECQAQRKQAADATETAKAAVGASLANWQADPTAASAALETYNAYKADAEEQRQKEKVARAKLLRIY